MTQDSSDRIIQISDLSFRYGETAVLEQVSLEVQRGEFLGLIGPNGGGKTTLLRLLLGLEQPQQGVIRIFGEHPRPGTGWRLKTGVVPQHRDTPQRFPLLVRDLVEMGLTKRGAARLSSAERGERIRDALDRVGISALEKRPVRELSGGQRQRAFVARALVSQPELLILDEPTVGVDAHGQDLLLQWITTWRRESKLTVILVSHDIGVIAPLADRLACLNLRLHFHDRPDRLTGTAIEQAYGCPAELIFHSHDLPHRVVGKHREP